MKPYLRSFNLCCNAILPTNNVLNIKECLRFWCDRPDTSLPDEYPVSYVTVAGVFLLGIVPGAWRQ